MSARTPGPWALPLQHTATAPQTTVIAERARDGCIVEVATTAGRGDSIHESEANARLIAAAPDLLACLKEAVASWDLADEDSDALPGDGDPLAEWKAAIAKAEGR